MTAWRRLSKMMGLTTCFTLIFRTCSSQAGQPVRAARQGKAPIACQQQAASAAVPASRAAVAAAESASPPHAPRCCPRMFDCLPDPGCSRLAPGGPACQRCMARSAKRTSSSLKKPNATEATCAVVTSLLCRFDCIFTAARLRRRLHCWRAAAGSLQAPHRKPSVSGRSFRMLASAKGLLSKKWAARSRQVGLAEQKHGGARNMIAHAAQTVEVAAVACRANLHFCLLPGDRSPTRQDCGP